MNNNVKTKIYNTKKLVSEIRKLKNKKLKIGLCHGLFDLMHPGHINHLNEAKRYCDILVVSTTADIFIKKNLKSPLFNQNQRAFFLSSLSMVDIVYICQEATAKNLLKKIKPNYYFKGKEYKTYDSIGNFKLEKNICKKNNIILKFIGNRIFSSTNLIKKQFYPIDDEFLKKNIKLLTNKEKNLENIFSKLKKLKILLIGEMIFDKYTFINTYGLSPKSSTVSGSVEKSVFMEGGILSSAKFLRQFSKNITCLSLKNKKKIFNKINYKFTKNDKIITSKTFPNIIKERILKSERNIEDLKKLLTINHFENREISKVDEIKIISFLKNNLHKYDLVIVQDFGHGLINRNIATLISKKSKYLSLNVQSNSMNFGFNIIDQKFKRADVFSLDKKELQLFKRKIDNINFEKTLSDLKKQLNSQIGLLTIGDEFSIINGNKENLKIPVLETKVVDTVGAGDIFHSFASILSVVTKNDFLIGFLSQISGSLSVKIMGNSRVPTVNEIKNTFNFYINN